MQTVCTQIRLLSKIRAHTVCIASIIKVVPLNVCSRHNLQTTFFKKKNVGRIKNSPEVGLPDKNSVDPDQKRIWIYFILFARIFIYINSLHPGYFFMFFFLSSGDCFQNQLIQKISFRNTIKVSNNFFVGPDLGPNCLQKLSADDTRRWRVNPYPTDIFCSENFVCEILRLMHLFRCTPDYYHIGSNRSRCGVVDNPACIVNQGSQVGFPASPVCRMRLTLWPRLHMSLAVGRTLNAIAITILEAITMSPDQCWRRSLVWSGSLLFEI